MTDTHDQADAGDTYNDELSDFEPSFAPAPAGEFDHAEPLDWSDAELDIALVDHEYFGDQQPSSAAGSDFVVSSLADLDSELTTLPWDVAGSVLVVSDPNHRLEPEDLLSPESQHSSPDLVMDTESAVLAAALGLSDEAVERVFQEWRRTFDIAGAFTRAQDTAPTSVDRRHFDLTADSRCIGGVTFLDGSATQVIHPRVTWRYCADPAALLVLAQPVPGSDGSLELQLWSGSTWIPLTERTDGYLSAQTPAYGGGQIMFRLVRKPR